MADGRARRGNTLFAGRRVPHAACAVHVVFRRGCCHKICCEYQPKHDAEEAERRSQGGASAPSSDKMHRSGTGGGGGGDGGSSDDDDDDDDDDEKSIFNVCKGLWKRV